MRLIGSLEAIDSGVRYDLPSLSFYSIVIADFEACIGWLDDSESEIIIPSQCLSQDQINRREDISALGGVNDLR